MPKNIKQQILVAFLMVCLGLFLVLVGTDVFPQEVGDKMPSLEGYGVTISGFWFNPDMTKWGVRVNMAKPDEEERYLVVYNECNGVPAELPFGIFDVTTKILYLDNAPTDGLVDAVVPNPTNYIYEDAPDCRKV